MSESRPRSRWELCPAAGSIPKVSGWRERYGTLVGIFVLNLFVVDSLFRETYGEHVDDSMYEWGFTGDVTRSR